MAKEYQVETEIRWHSKTGGNKAVLLAARSLDAEEHRRLLYGTGQDGGVRPEQTVSNIYKMYRAARVSFDNGINPVAQVTMYDPGLGTDIGATALTAPRRYLQKLLASVDGRGITTNIADCYTFILNHYQPNDRIFLFGFSRGAYTVRSVADLLRLCGVPTKTLDGPAALKFRQRRRRHLPPARFPPFEAF